jgi:hypothetical protein
MPGQPSLFQDPPAGTPAQQPSLFPERDATPSAPAEQAPPPGKEEAEPEPAPENREAPPAT